MRITCLRTCQNTLFHVARQRSRDCRRDLLDVGDECCLQLIKCEHIFLVNISLQRTFENINHFYMHSALDVLNVKTVDFTFRWFFLVPKKGWLGLGARINISNLLVYEIEPITTSPARKCAIFELATPACITGTLYKSWGLFGRLHFHITFRGIKFRRCQPEEIYVLLWAFKYVTTRSSVKQASRCAIDDPRQ